MQRGLSACGSSVRLDTLTRCLNDVVVADDRVFSNTDRSKTVKVMSCRLCQA